MENNAFDKIIGYTAVKKELEKLSDALKHPEAYAKLGAYTPRGLLLHGKAGVGKTLMADCLVRDCGRRVYPIRRSDASGDFCAHIRKVFAQAAEQHAPSIVLMDDLDKFSDDKNSDSNANEFVTVQSCIDACKGQNVFVLATANNVTTLPRSLRRPGRFDHIIEVGTPVGKDAEDIIAFYLSDKQHLDDIDAGSLARMLEGYSCATLETVINEAAVRAAFYRRDSIANEDLIEVCLNQLFDVPENMEESTQTPEELEHIAYHEAGHAVVSEMLMPDTMTVMCIRSERGNRGLVSYAGSTIGASCEALEAQAARSLGGKAAIELKYGMVDHGCTRDINHAIGSLSTMVDSLCSYGFSAVTPFDQESDALKNRTESLVNAELGRVYMKAKRIIAENRDMLEAFASALLEKQVLTRGDIKKIREQVLAARETAA